MWQTTCTIPRMPGTSVSSTSVTSASDDAPLVSQMIAEDSQVIPDLEHLPEEYVGMQTRSRTKFVAASTSSRCTSHLTPHTSHLTPHTSHLTHHTSHLTPHTSHLTPHACHPAGYPGAHPPAYGAAAPYGYPRKHYPSNPKDFFCLTLNPQPRKHYPLPSSLNDVFCFFPNTINKLVHLTP